MQAWGSLAGLVMSTFAVIFTGLLFRHEIRVRRDEQRDQEAAQARLVVGRIVGYGPQATTLQWGPLDLVHGSVTQFEWSVKNYSSAPILDFDIRVVREKDGREWIGLHPGNDVVEGEILGRIILDDPVEIPDGTMLASAFRLVITYVDAEGRSWMRVGRDEPIRTIGAYQRVPLVLGPRWPRPWFVKRKEREMLERFLSERALRTKPTTARRPADGAPAHGEGQAAD